MQLRRQITLKSVHIICHHAWSDVTPATGIWWLRAVLHQFRLTFTVRHKVNLIFNSQTYLHVGLSFVFKFSDVPGTSELRCTPGRGIWWLAMVLHQVILTFGHPLGQNDIQSDGPSYRHLVTKTGTKMQGIMGSNCCHLLFNYWRGKSYIAMQENELIWFIENWKGNVCRLIFLLLLLMCNCVVVVNL